MCVARTVPECRILSHAVNVRTAPRLSKHPLTSISKARACVLSSDSRSEIADDLGSRAPRGGPRREMPRTRPKAPSHRPSRTAMRPSQRRGMRGATLRAPKMTCLTRQSLGLPALGPSPGIEYFSDTPAERSICARLRARTPPVHVYHESTRPALRITALEVAAVPRTVPRWGRSPPRR